MKKYPQQSRAQGFTLIEILIVIGILAVLAAIVLVAINPARQFRQANNSQRVSNVNAILNAIGQYVVDEKGTLPTEILDTAREIGGASSNADLCTLLVPKYLPALPADPSLDDQSITEDECGDTPGYVTGYEVESENGRIIVSAPQTENEDTGAVVTGDDVINVTR